MANLTRFRIISRVLKGWQIGCTLEDYKIEPGEMLSLKPGATLVQKYKNLYQLCLDKCTAYTKVRWVAELSLVVLFLNRFVPLLDCYVYDSKLFDDLLINFWCFTWGFLYDKLLQQEEGNLDVGEKLDDFHPILSRPPEFRIWYYCIRTTYCYCTVLK
ncbi:Protein RER1 [Nakaseomyces glabratus]|nr:Protein RER1 [Nakaseomyces glabratus]KTB16496.1 Protein RER1 [Nakaseomyces glabratus]